MKTNCLNSHHGESANSRADKMSGIYKAKIHLRQRSKENGWGDGEQNKRGADGKKFYGHKRRMFLKNQQNWEKI